MDTEEQGTSRRGDSRSVSGLLKSYHGIAYQVQWLMVVALEAKQRLDDSDKNRSAFTFKIKDFMTEDANAGKFDDLVWRYEIDRQNGQTTYQYNFLQAKHKLNEVKEISLKELLKPKQKESAEEKKGEDKQPFALQKYFVSYKDVIKTEQKYKDGFVDKLIIATDVSLDNDLKSTLFSPAEEESLPVLDLIKSETGKEPDVWKIETEEGFHYEKIINLFQGTYVSMKLANELVESVLSRKSVSEKSFLSLYLFDLKQNKIIGEAGKFSPEFLENSELSPKAKEFRKCIFKVGFEDKRLLFNGNYILSKPKEFAKKIANIIYLSAQKSEEESDNIEVRIIKTSEMKENVIKLKNYVFVKDYDKKIKFSSIFWEKKDNELPGNLKDFRGTLKGELVKLSEKKSIKPKHPLFSFHEQDTLAEIARKFQKYFFKISEFTTCHESLVDENSFWKAMGKGVFGNIDANSPDNKELPTESLENVQKEINEFLSKLRFVVNYSQGDLDKFIGEKCKTFLRFETDYVAYKFQVKVGNALNLATQDFISDCAKVKQFFEESQKQLVALALVGLTLEYGAKIEQYGVEFRSEYVEDLLKLKNEPKDFLKSNKQIFSLITEQKDLTSMKFIQALEIRDEFKNLGNHASLSLNSAVLLQDFVLDALESEAINLLVIKCDAAVKNIGDFCRKLSDLLSSHKSKKIILITQEKNDLVTSFEDRFSGEYEEKNDHQIGFVDFTVPSQNKLLTERTVIFQGKETVLGELLIDKKSKKLIKGEELFDLIEKKRINIGSPLLNITHLNSPAFFKVMEVIDEKCLKDIKDDIFVINGICRESLAGKLETEVDDIVELSEELIFSQENSPQFVVLNCRNDDKGLEYFEDVCRQYYKQQHKEKDKKLIHFIEFHDDKFLWNRYYDPNFYFHRHFNKIIIDRGKLFKNYSAARTEDIFLISKIQKDEFVKQYRINEDRIASTCHELNDDKDFLILGIDEEEEVREIFKDLGLNNNVHWLEKDENELVWKCSSGSIGSVSKLRREITSSEVNRIPQSRLVDIIKKERLAVIADVPGMGKSTTLLSLSEYYKNLHPLDWVINVDLKGCEHSIDKILRDFEDPIDNTLKKTIIGTVVNFLSEIDPKGLEHHLAKKILRHKLFSHSDSGLVLLLDGFDEIGGDDLCLSSKQKKILKLLKFFKESSVKVLVTTRPYEDEKKKLEDSLSVLSRNFNPIAEEDGPKFIERVWRNSLKLKNGLNVPNLQRFVSDLCNKCRKVFGKELSSFIGVPLQLLMLAEAYLNDYRNLDKNQEITDETPVKELLEGLNFSSLYRNFTAKKYEIYFQEKNRFGKTVQDSDIERLRKSYQKDHKHLAFEYFFADVSSERFKQICSLFFLGKKLKNISKLKELNRVGITHIKGDDNIGFVHRTFAEYFISELIFDKFKEKIGNSNYSLEWKKAMWEFMLNFVFLQNSYKVIRNFINSKLSSQNLFEDFETKFSEHEDIVHGLLRETVGGKKIGVQRGWGSSHRLNLLEVAADEGLSEIVEFILKIAPSSYINDNIESQGYATCEMIPASSFVPMYYALVGCHFKVIKVLVKYAKKVGKSYDLVNFKDERRKPILLTALHVAARASSFEMVKFFVDNGANVRAVFTTYLFEDEYCQNDFTPLHSALMTFPSTHYPNDRDRIKIVQYLLANGADVYDKDEQGNTVLHFACLGSHADAIKNMTFQIMPIWQQFYYKSSESFTSAIRSVVRKQSPEFMREMVELLISEAQVSSTDGDRSLFCFINAENKQGYTPIFLAAASGLWKIVDYLLKMICRVVFIKENKFGTTTLHYLAAEAEEDLTELLEHYIRKSAGIGIDTKTKDMGETPLHWAAKNNNVRAIEVLLRNNHIGIEKNVRNKNGQTAFDLCLDPTIRSLLE